MASKDASHFTLSSPPKDAISAVTFLRDSNTHLLVASWDRHVYLYDISTDALIRTFEHRAPVLDICAGSDASHFFSVGLDWDVRRIEVSSGSQTVLNSHEAPSCKIVYHTERELLISASWDRTLHIQNPYSTAPFTTLPLPAKPYAIGLSPSKLVVAMADRKLYVWDIPALATFTAEANGGTLNAAAFQERESALKFLTRAVACMPNDAGYVCSSIEGRVAVEWFDPSKEAQARNYAFKTHRQTVHDPETGEEIDEVHPVHALAFNPVHGTFITCGGDGAINLWDPVAKRRIKGYPRYDASVAAVGFSQDGTRLAVGVSPGFEDGDEEADGAPDADKIQVWIRELADAEMKQRGK